MNTEMLSIVHVSSNLITEIMTIAALLSIELAISRLALMVGKFHKPPPIGRGKAPYTHTARDQDGTGDNICFQLVDVGSTTTMSIEPRTTVNDQKQLHYGLPNYC